MRSPKPPLMIILLAVFLLSGIVVLSAYQHEANKRIFLSYFQEHQLLHAEHIADKIATLLWGYRRVLEALPSAPNFLVEDMERLQNDIETYSNHMEEDYVDKIFLYDETGEIFCSTESDPTGLSEDETLLFSWAQKKENRGKLLVSPLLTSLTSSFRVSLLVPLYHRIPSEKPDQWNWRFTGALSFSVDLKKFLASELNRFKMSTHQIWIMDRDGRLLFQSDHPEMVARNLRQRDETCNRCHISINYIENILQNAKGTIDYHVKDAPKKIAAFAPVKFGDISWVVVVNSPYDSVSAFTRKSLRQSLLLLGPVALSFILGSAYLIHSARMKGRAEEESKHWQEMTAEREKSEEALKRSEGQLRHLSSKLLTAQEEERRRISKELHDELGGALVTLRLRENLLKRNLNTNQLDLTSECEKNIEYIDQTVEEVHRMLKNLTPSVLEHLGLSAALRRLVNDLEQRDSIRFTLDMNHIDPLLSKEAQIAIYRIFQEALTNIEKYARATNVMVMMRENKDHVSFSITDDGMGFDLMKAVSQNITERGLGLTTMEERVRMMGGQFEIWTEEGKGTRITFQIPKAERGVTVSEYLSSRTG